MAEQAYWLPTGEAFGRYILTSGRSSETKRTYLGCISVFWRWCAAQRFDPYEADTAVIGDWLAVRMGCVSNAQTHKDIAALKCFYRWLVETKARSDNPAELLKVKRRRQAPTRPLSLRDLTELLVACNSERDKLIILTLVHVGARISELAGMRVGDINWDKGTLLVRGKGSKDRQLPISPVLLGRLRSWFGMFAEGSIWRSEYGNELSAHQIRKIIYAIAKRAKIEHVHPHRFRSTFGTEFLEQFGDIQALQYLMGHESIETTAKYTEYTKMQRAQKMMSEFNLGGSLTA